MYRSTHLGRAVASTHLRSAVALCALAGALALTSPAADASAIHACVNKRSGNARIVGAKASCRRGERKMSWNAAGPAGTPGSAGSPGTAGTNGANGVGADYTAVNNGLSPLGVSENGDIVVAKTIPAGSYFVNAKTVIGATKAKSAVFVVVICQLVDSTGVPRFAEPTDALDFGEWAQQLSLNEGEWEAVTTIALQGQLTTTEPSTVAMICLPVVGGKEATFDAVAGQVSALQVTANR